MLKRLNSYFFGEEEAAGSDMAWYYGMIAGAAVICLFTFITIIQ